MRQFGFEVQFAATCLRIPQGCCEEQTRQGRKPRGTLQRHGQQAWAFPSARASDHSYLPPPAHLVPGPLSCSRPLIWLSVCQPIPSTGRHPCVYTRTTLPSAQIVSERQILAVSDSCSRVHLLRRWGTGGSVLSTYLQAAATAQVSMPRQKEHSSELPL